MSDVTKFVMFAMKKNGDERRKECDTINEAVRALWRVRDVVEGYIHVIHGGRKYKLLAKIGRRRGINTRFATAVDGRPALKKAGDGWQRLPSRFNDLQ